MLRIYSTKGLYLGAIFGGLVNSSAAVAEVAARVQGAHILSKITVLCLLTTIAMCVRNLVLATLFAPGSISATLLPLLIMSLVTGIWIWFDLRPKDDLPV